MGRPPEAAVAAIGEPAWLRWALIALALALLGLLVVMPLAVVVVEDGRAILSSHVVALPIERRGIMRLEEHSEQIGERDLGRVVRHLHDFGVAGSPGTDLLIRRLLDIAAAVTARD